MFFMDLGCVQGVYMATRISVHDTSTIAHDGPGYRWPTLLYGRVHLCGESFREITSTEASSMRNNSQSGKSRLS